MTNPVPIRAHRGLSQAIYLSRDISMSFERAEFFALIRTGVYTPIFRGIYALTAEWNELGDDARYLRRISAASAYSPQKVVFSHQSAAALWRLPSITPWPRTVHTLGATAAGGRSNTMFARHGGAPITHTETIDGLCVTSLARTVIDIAIALPFPQAVTMADAALHRTANPIDDVAPSSLVTADLLAELTAVPVKHGSAKARRVVTFANGAADRPGESLSRVNMSLAGITTPELQVELKGISGRTYFVDFWWPHFSMIGEFDGRHKYTDPNFLRGRTPQQVFAQEKDREDDLRAAGHGMTRWPWSVAIDPQKLYEHLLRAGIR